MEWRIWQKIRGYLPNRGWVTLPKYPYPVTFWETLTVPSIYNEMLQSQTPKKEGNVSATREEIFSKFANLSNQTKLYSNVGDFRALFRREFPQKYELLVRSKPRSERTAILEEIYEKFDKVLEVYFSINRGGRPKGKIGAKPMGFQDQIEKLLQKDNLNDDDIDKLNELIKEKYEEFGGIVEKESKPDETVIEKKKRTIEKVKKALGSENRKEIVKILARAGRDSFKMATLEFRIATTGVTYPTMVAGFKRISTNDRSVKGRAGFGNKTYTVYSKKINLLESNQEKLKEIEKSWIDALIDKEILREVVGEGGERRKYVFGNKVPEKDTVERGKKNVPSLNFFVDKSLLYEILISVDNIKFSALPQGETTTYNVGTIEIKAFLDFMGADASVTRLGKISKRSILPFVSNLSKDKEISLLYDTRRTPQRYKLHPTLKRAFESSGGDLYVEATKSVLQDTATSLKGEEQEAKREELTGVTSFDENDVNEILKKNIMTGYKSLFKKAIGKERPTKEDFIGTDMSNSLVLGVETRTYATTNAKLISFMNLMIEMLKDDGKISRAKLNKNKDRILAGITGESSNSQIEKDFINFLKGKKVTGKTADEVLDRLKASDPQNQYFRERMDSSDAFSYLFAIAYRFGDGSIENDMKTLLTNLEVEEDGKKIIRLSQDLSTDDQSLVNNITTDIQQTLTQTKEKFEQELKQKFEQISKNPADVPKKLIDKLIENGFLEEEEWNE